LKDRKVKVIVTNFGKKGFKINLYLNLTGNESIKKEKNKFNLNDDNFITEVKKYLEKKISGCLIFNVQFHKETA
jgi:hypothetical protein